MSQIGTESTNALAVGWGRALVFVYGVFAVAATGRSVLQISTEFDKAPLAYCLSLLAAAVYLVATTALLLGGRTGWRVAAVAVSVELQGCCRSVRSAMQRPTCSPTRPSGRTSARATGTCPGAAVRRPRLAAAHATRAGYPT